MREYIWRDGDSVISVASRFGLNENAINAANPTVSFESLREGMKIALPAPGVGCPSCGVHVVLPGQSIYSIARLLGVSALSLMNANPYCDPTSLTCGEVLLAPEREFCYARYGDRLITLSSRYNVPIWRVAELNQSLGNGVLAPGTRVRLK